MLALSALHVDDTRVLSSTVFIFVLQQGRILFLMALVIMRGRHLDGRCVHCLILDALNNLGMHVIDGY